MACKFIWGEVKELNGDEKTATYKPMFQSGREPWVEQNENNYSSKLRRAVCCCLCFL